MCGVTRVVVCGGRGGERNERNVGQRSRDSPLSTVGDWHCWWGLIPLDVGDRHSLAIASEESRLTTTMRRHKDTLVRVLIVVMGSGQW